MYKEIKTPFAQYRCGPYSPKDSFTTDDIQKLAIKYVQGEDKPVKDREIILLMLSGLINQLAHTHQNRNPSIDVDIFINEGYIHAAKCLDRFNCINSFYSFAKLRCNYAMISLIFDTKNVVRYSNVNQYKLNHLVRDSNADDPHYAGSDNKIVNMWDRVYNDIIDKREHLNTMDAVIYNDIIEVIKEYAKQFKEMDRDIMLRYLNNVSLQELSKKYNRKEENMRIRWLKLSKQLNEYLISIGLNLNVDNKLRDVHNPIKRYRYLYENK